MVNQSENFVLGTKFFVREVRRWSKKRVLPFKEDQGERYERYDRQISIYCFQLEKFSTLFSVDLWST